MILNIRIFHSRDATIQNSIEKSFKKQVKNQWKLIEKRVQNQTPCRGSSLEPFWSHFGSILSPFSTRNHLFGAQSRPKSLPGGLWNAASIFIDCQAFFQVAPAAGGGAVWRDPTPGRTGRPRGETTDFQENPAGSRVPALVATMGLGSLSIGSFASY